MTQKEIIALVRKLIADEQATGYTEGGNLELPEGTQELLHYLDRAVDTYSETEVAAGNIRFLKPLTAINGHVLPVDFIRFAGLVPIDTTGGTMQFFGEMTTLTVKYFARLPHISTFAETAELPFRLEEARRLAALAAIYALNKHEFNVSQDLMLLGMGGGGVANGGQ